MLDILQVTFPFFALVLCGYVAARRRMLPLEAIGGLNGFVLYFALPAMLYRFGAETPIARLFDPAVLAVWLPCALLMVAITVRFSRGRGLVWNDAAFGALVAAFPNTGFMGVPLLIALLGAAAAGPTIATILIDMVITTSVCVALSRLDGAGQRGAAEAARKALKGVALNPLPWAILLGGLSSALALRPVAPIMGTIELLADAASPVALFTIGAVLARSQLLAAEAERQAPQAREFLPVALAKLLLHPLLVLGVGALARWLGLPLDAFSLGVLVLVAALPSASNVAMLAERYGADTGRIARIILLTTAASFFSFSAAVALMK
ncbi:AEC family transporter [Ramlibacter rhizophilus]|uniref:AEC family transporter n=1 Tax=Ramlibacter rhizophilus TaxID=1781167 RepID=A0A4Z0BED6_9BURK|nr:AEC family transporter [Ramlibacter rhizophilus]TFY96248.1 AEC family transporter [Ramlibacter rhizophilus]